MLRLLSSLFSFPPRFVLVLVLSAAVLVLAARWIRTRGALDSYSRRAGFEYEYEYEYRFAEYEHD